MKQDENNNLTDANVNEGEKAFFEDYENLPMFSITLDIIENDERFIIENF